MRCRSACAAWVVKTERLRSCADYRAYRVADEGLVAETDPDGAPHGTTWLCAPSSRLRRLEPLLA